MGGCLSKDRWLSIVCCVSKGDKQSSDDAIETDNINNINTNTSDGNKSPVPAAAKVKRSPSKLQKRNRPKSTLVENPPDLVPEGEEKGDVVTGGEMSEAGEAEGGRSQEVQGEVPTAGTGVEAGVEAGAGAGAAAATAIHEEKRPATPPPPPPQPEQAVSTAQQSSVEDSLATPKASAAVVTEHPPTPTTAIRSQGQPQPGTDAISESQHQTHADDNSDVDSVMTEKGAPATPTNAASTAAAAGGGGFVSGLMVPSRPSWDERSMSSESEYYSVRSFAT